MSGKVIARMYITNGKACDFWYYWKPLGFSTTYNILWLPISPLEQAKNACLYSKAPVSTRYRSVEASQLIWNRAKPESRYWYLYRLSGRLREERMYLSEGSGSFTISVVSFLRRRESRISWLESPGCPPTRAWHKKHPDAWSICNQAWLLLSWRDITG